MIVFDGRGILLDVEGTTSSISFVYDVLFEFAKRHVGDFLAARRDDPARAASRRRPRRRGRPATPTPLDDARRTARSRPRSTS